MRFEGHDGRAVARHGCCIGQHIAVVPREQDCSSEREHALSGPGCQEAWLGVLPQELPDGAQRSAMACVSAFSAEGYARARVSLALPRKLAHAGHSGGALGSASLRSATRMHPGTVATLTSATMQRA